MKNLQITSLNETSRPWGIYEVFHEEPGWKIKRITVHPGKRLSLQKHKHRSEYWTIIDGFGIANVGFGSFNVSKGSILSIDPNQIHRIKNIGKKNLTFIEVQLGNYLGEDDIERIEDDFGRALEKGDPTHD